MEEGVIAGIAAGAIAFILLIIAFIRNKRSAEIPAQNRSAQYYAPSSTGRLFGIKTFRGSGMKSKTKKNK